jgi:hypothetical protein
MSSTSVRASSRGLFEATIPRRELSHEPLSSRRAKAIEMTHDFLNGSDYLLGGVDGT